MRDVTVRADEVRRGDVIACGGVVGTVVDHFEVAGSLPRVYVTVRTDWGTEAHDTFTPDRPIVREVPDAQNALCECGRLRWGPGHVAH